MQAWETLSRRVILGYSKFLTVEEHAVQLPDGQVISDWPWVVTPDFVNVVAVTEEGRYLCFRQTKYGIDGTSLAPVGGFMEPGEEPLAAAQRELLEETGYEGAEWIPLGSYRVDANRGAGMAYFFLALGVRRITEAVSDDLE
jgi:ADP-ribose pyrophosphatase